MTVCVYRPVNGRIEISGMPRPGEDEPRNKDWFKDQAGRAIRPTWVSGPRGWDGHWALAREHFAFVTRSLASRFGTVEVVLDFNEHERCDRRCRDATGDDCTCSCLGRHHGGGIHTDWLEVGETTLVRHEGVNRVTATVTREQL